VDSELLLPIIRIVSGIAVIGFFGGWALRRGLWLYKLVKAAQPAPERNIRAAFKGNIKHAISNIFGNEKLLRWSLPGIAHFWVMWAFFIVQSSRSRCSTASRWPASRPMTCSGSCRTRSSC